MDSEADRQQLELRLDNINNLLDSLHDVEDEVRTTIIYTRSALELRLRLLDERSPTPRTGRDERDNFEGSSRRMEEKTSSTVDRQLAMRLQDLQISASDSRNSLQDETSMPAVSYRGKGKQRETANELNAGTYEQTTRRSLGGRGRTEDTTSAERRGITSRKMLGMNKQREMKELNADAFEETTRRPLHMGGHTEEATSLEERGTTSQGTLGKGKQREEEFDDDEFAVALSLPSRSGLIEDGTGAGKRFQCCACMEMRLKKHIVTLGCGHDYCRICHVSLFRNAIADPTLFPPQCCGVPLPLETSLPLLPGDLVKKVDLKAEELATPNPTHCSNADCAEFLRSQEIQGDVGTCPFCGEETCVQCKSKSHEGFCQSDPEVQRLIDAAKRSRWQQCTKCRNMVELSSGCFHMTYVSEHRIDDGLVTYNGRCRCKHEFCYICGA
jgi:E3 ubiquitin-protein ligase RNF144